MTTVNTDATKALGTNKYTIGVISNAQNESMEQLKAAASKQDVTLIQIPLYTIELTDFPSKPLLDQLQQCDAIYYRSGLLHVGLEAFIKTVTKLGIPLINTNHQSLQMHKKSYQASICHEHNIFHPRTFYSKMNTYEEIARALGHTFVIKPDIGSHGSGVAVIDSPETLNAYLQEYGSVKTYIYQELLTEHDEYRVYTIAGKSVASYKKIIGDDGFTANIHTGGKIIPTESERQEILYLFAEQIAQKLQIDIAGIDILMKENVCCLLEINRQPGWKRLDEIHNIDFADETISYIKNRIEESQKV